MEKGGGGGRRKVERNREGRIDRERERERERERDGRRAIRKRLK